MSQLRKTKIICTLGPATDDVEVLKQLLLGGLNVARLNFSHGTHEQQFERLERFINVRDELGVRAATLLDTKGPEVRIGEFADDSVMLKKGQKFTLTTEDVEGDNTRVSISYKNLPKDITPGTRILIDDGLIETTVLAVTSTDIVCEVLNDGPISNKKSLNIPSVSLNMPYVSEKDHADIVFAAENDFDYVAASFARTAADILEIRKILAANNGNDILVIAKIENMEGLKNIHSILEVSDGIMIARGDLGVEMDFEEIPAIQKKLIKHSLKVGKIVITATQMLESMTHNPRPTRAEASDVANAVYDGTSALMLSGETAVGHNPVLALKTMARIAELTEGDIDYKKRFETGFFDSSMAVCNAISHSTVTMAHHLDVAAIITTTSSGHITRTVAAFRPETPIIAITSKEKVTRQLCMSWGVTSVCSPLQKTTDEMFLNAIDEAKKTGIVKAGDLTVITAGTPDGVSGTTNVLKVHKA